jgi:TP901 family phage tail tape measure protein
MSNPTLALGISAPGKKDIVELAAAVQSLTTNLAQLAAAGRSPVANLDKVTSEVAAIRKGMVEAVAGIRTDISELKQVLAESFKQAAASVAVGGKQVSKEVADAAADVAKVSERLHQAAKQVAVAMNTATGAYQRYNSTTGLKGALVLPKFSDSDVRKLETDAARIAAAKERIASTEGVSDSFRLLQSELHKDTALLQSELSKFYTQLSADVTRLELAQARIANPEVVSASFRLLQSELTKNTTLIQAELSKFYTQLSADALRLDAAKARIANPEVVSASFRLLQSELHNSTGLIQSELSRYYSRLQSDSERIAAAWRRIHNPTEVSASFRSLQSSLHQDKEVIQAELSRYYTRLESDGQRLAAAWKRIANPETVSASFRSLQSELHRNTAAVQLQLTQYYSELERISNLKGAIRDRLASGNVGAVRPGSGRLTLDQQDQQRSEAMAALRQHYESLQPAPTTPAAVRRSSVAAPSMGSLNSVPATLRQTAVNAADASGTLRLMTKDLNDAHSAARGLASGFGAMWLTWGNMAPLLAGAALSQSFVQTIKMGAAVQQELSIIQVLSQETDASVAGLNAQLLELSRTGPFGPKEVAEAMKILALAGLDAEKVGTAIKDVLNFAVAGTTSIKSAADVMTTVATAFSISAKHYNYVGDVISKTAAVSKSSVESIGEAFKTASVVNSQYGASLEDVGVGLALLSNAGITGSAAGTALRNMYVDILGRTPKVQAAIKTLTGTTDAFFDKTTGKAKDLVTMFMLLETRLQKLDPISQTKALQAVFSERGGKEAVEIRKAIQQRSADMGLQYENYLLELKAKIDNASGFMAISAANLAMTPLNQMKSVVATLQATMVETFSSIEPQVISLSQSLKGLFNSEQFKEGLKDLVVGMARLVELIVDNARALGTLLALYAGWRIAMGVASVIEVLTSRLWAKTAALKASTIATMELAAAQRAQAVTSAASSASMLAGVGGAAGLARGVGTLASVFVRWIPYIGLAWTALELYSLWTTKSSESNAKLAASTAGSLMESLKNEAARLKEINEAKQAGLTLDDLKSIKARQTAMEALRQPVTQAETELQRAEQLRDAPNLDEAAKKRRAGIVKQRQQDLELAKATYREQSRELSRLQADVERQAEIGKQQALEEERKRLAAMKSGKGTFTGVDDPAETARAATNNELRQLETQQKRVEDALKARYEMEVALNDARHRAGILSEGAYQSQNLQIVQRYEQAQMEHLNESLAAHEEAHTRRRGQLTAAIKDPKQLQEALIQLANEWESYFQGYAKGVSVLNTGVERRQATSVITLEGEVRKLAETNDQYWLKAESAVQTEAKQATTRRELASLSEAMRVRREAEIEVEGRHAVHLANLTSEYDKAQAAMLDFTAGKTDIFALTEEESKAYAGLTQRILVLAAALELSAEKVALLKKLAGDAAVVAASNTSAESLRKEYESTAKSISGSLADALIDGGKDGTNSMLKQLKEALKKPLKVVLQAFMQPMGNMLASMVYPQAATSGAVGSTLGSAGSSMLGSMGSSMLGSSLLGGASAFGTGVTSGLTAWGAGGSVSGLLGAGSSLFSGGIMSGLGTIMGALGPIAIGIALLATLIKDGGGPKSDGRYGTTFSDIAEGTQNGGPNPLQATAKTMVQGLEQQYNAMASLFGVAGQTQFGLSYTIDPQGDAPSFLEVAASRNGQQVYSNANRDVGREESDLKKAVEDQIPLAMFAALKASDLTPAFRAYFDSISDDSAAEVKTAAMTTAQNVQKLTVNMLSMGNAFADFDELTVEARENIINMAGGLDALLAATATYYEKFYSEQERNANASADLATTFGKLNLTVPLTNAGFRALVEAQDLTTESGRKAYAALIGVAGAFDTVVSTLRSSTSNALKELSDSLKAMAERVKTANEGVQSARNDIADAYQRSAQKLADAQQKVLDLQEQQTKATETFGKTLREYLYNLQVGPNSTSPPAARYQMLQREFNQTALLASGGDQNARDNLTSVADAFLEASRGRASTSLDAARDQAKVRIVMERILATLPTTSTEKSIEQQILDAQAEELKLQGERDQYYALMVETGTSMDTGVWTVASEITELRTAYNTARIEQSAANLDLLIAVSALGQLGLTEDMINGLLNGQTGAAPGDFAEALGVPDSAILALQSAMKFTDAELEALSDALNIEVAPYIYDHLALALVPSTTALDSLSTSLGPRVDLMQDLKTSLGISDIQFKELQEVLGLTELEMTALNAALGVDPVQRGEWATALGYDATKLGPLSTALGYDQELTVPLLQALGLKDSTVEWLEQAGTLVGFTPGANTTVEELATKVGFSVAAEGTIASLNTALGLSPAAQAAITGLLNFTFPTGVPLGGPTDFQWYLDALNRQSSAGDRRAPSTGSDGGSGEYIDWGAINGFAVGTNRVPRDMLAMIHKDEAIVPAAYNPAVGGQGAQDAMLTELRAVRNELAKSNRELAAMKIELGLVKVATASTDKTLKNVTGPTGGSAFATQAA